MIIGINCTKNTVILAETSDNKADFEATKITRFEFSLKSARDCTELQQNLKTILAAINKDATCRAVILACSAGTHGSSIEAIKAEAMLELVCDNLGIEISYVKPQSLKSTLGCVDKEPWQKKAKELFNSSGSFKYFNKGSDGAVAVAFKGAK